MPLITGSYGSNFVPIGYQAGPAWNTARNIAIGSLALSALAAQDPWGDIVRILHSSGSDCEYCGQKWARSEFRDACVYCGGPGELT